LYSRQRCRWTEKSHADRHQAGSKGIVAEAGRDGSLFRRVKSLSSSIAEGGKIDAEGVQIPTAKDVGIYFTKEFDSKASEASYGPITSSIRLCI
jgi:hypothetical protein